VRSESDLRKSARDMIAARCRCPPAHPMPEKRPQKREDPGRSCSPRITTRGSELDGHSDIRMSDVAGCRFPRIIHAAYRCNERSHRLILPSVKRLRIPAKIRGAAGFLLPSGRAGVGSIGGPSAAIDHGEARAIALGVSANMLAHGSSAQTTGQPRGGEGAMHRNSARFQHCR